MKKIPFLSFVIFFYCFNAKAQDTAHYWEMRFGAGGSNSGINLYNQIGSNFNLPDMGIASGVTSVSFVMGLKKFSMEAGIDFGSKDKSANGYEFQSEILNARYSYKYRMVNTKHSDINVFGDLGIQTIGVQIDSINRRATLLDFTSTSFTKSFITVGPGVEYMYKLMRARGGFVLGLRTSYNFYTVETEWAKGISKNYKEYSDKDLGYFQITLFFGSRFFPKGN